MWTTHELESRKPWLIRIQDDVFSIESRLMEVDEGYRVYYNVRKRKFEIHNLNSRGSTICIVADELDARIIDRINRSYVAYHGDELDKVDEYNRIMEEEAKKQNKKKMEDASHETYGPLKRAILKDELHSGYESIHIMPKLKGGAENDRSRSEGSGTA